MNKYTIGVDQAKKGGVMQIGAIYFDEASDFFWAKWYRNPIGWYKQRKVRRIIDRMPKATIFSTPHSQNNYFAEIYKRYKK